MPGFAGGYSHYHKEWFDCSACKKGKYKSYHSQDYFSFCTDCNSEETTSSEGSIPASNDTNEDSAPPGQELQALPGEGVIDFEDDGNLDDAPLRESVLDSLH